MLARIGAPARPQLDFFILKTLTNSSLNLQIMKKDLISECVCTCVNVLNV